MKSNQQEKCRYPENKRVGDKLSLGDRLLIKEKTGYSRSYIDKILKGKRHSDKVIKVAKELLSIREEFLNS